MVEYTALIAGVTGAVGGALARELVRHPQWQVYGLARRKPASAIDGVSYLQADMNQADALRDALTPVGNITHLFYCGRATHAEQVLEDASANLRLLDNLVAVTESISPSLAHVHLVQGGKVYGVHVGPFPTPAREDDTRAPIPNFNYEQEDYLRARSKIRGWHWSASRPNTLLHYSPAIARNLVSTLGAYAAICRELGAALDFPGVAGAYESITQVTSIELLARAIAWMATDPRCANQAFNVTNTDVFRWRALWSRLAHAFDMPVGSVRPLHLAEVLSERGDVWEQICQRYRLRRTSLDQVANWGYADATLERYWDEILCHNKARDFGFNDWDDSQARFFGVLEQYRQSELLPR